MSFSSLTLLDGNTAYVAALGSLDFATNAVLSRDSFLRVDLAAGTATALAMSSPYGFGDSLVAGGRVLLADGDPTKPGVRVFAADVTGAEGAVLNPDPTHSLPPRALTVF